MIGKTVSQYRILAKLGRGGMGEVYLAEDEQLGRKVAIKFLPPDVATDEHAKQRLLREARTAATLDHPNICAIYEIGQEGQHSFIVLQYIEGQTLAAKLKSQLPDVPEALAIAEQVAEALREAHTRGVVHRDIKPENIMLTSRSQVKVLDFGLAKMIHDPSQTSGNTATMLSVPGMVLGTVPYMSPEQVRGEELDSRTDIFSFGIVFYELLSGRRPFEAKSTAELISAILTSDPPPISFSNPGHLGSSAERLIRKCLEKDPARRYQAMADLIVDLQRIRRESETGHFAQTAIMTSAQTATAKRGLSGKRLEAVIAAVILAVAGATYLYSVRTPKAAARTAALTANPAAYDNYLRGKVNVSSENRKTMRLPSSFSNEPSLRIRFSRLLMRSSPVPTPSKPAISPQLPNRKS